MTIYFLLAVAIEATAQEASVCQAVLQPGEVLQYKVKWNFLRLGTITMKAERDSLNVDSTSYKLILNVESNPDLVFIKIKEYNESVVNASDMMSRHFFAMHNSNGNRQEIHHDYDEANHRASISVKDLNAEKLLQADTIEHAVPYVDGPALFFYTRWQSKSKQILKAPTLVGETIENTTLDFTHRREYIEIDASHEPIRARKYTGSADWKGGTAAGISGDFAGWVSDDEAAIPLRAEMKVLLGSITLELEKWTRPGWAPPTYVEIANH